MTTCCVTAFTVILWNTPIDGDMAVTSFLVIRVFVYSLGVINRFPRSQEAHSVRLRTLKLLAKGIDDFTECCALVYFGYYGYHRGIRRTEPIISLFIECWLNCDLAAFTVEVLKSDRIYSDGWRRNRVLQ